MHETLIQSIQKTIFIKKFKLYYKSYTYKTSGALLVYISNVYVSSYFELMKRSF